MGELQQDSIDRRLSQTVGDARKKIDASNRKGQTCVVDGHTFCQEGYCSECEIAKKREG